MWMNFNRKWLCLQIPSENVDLLVIKLLSYYKNRVQYEMVGRRVSFLKWTIKISELILEANTQTHNNKFRWF